MYSFLYLIKMFFKMGYSSFTCVLLWLILDVLTSVKASTCDNSSFPSFFKFGAATSAYQIEGAWKEDGKSRSWWDWFMNEYPAFNNNATGNIAADSYHKFKEDIAAMKEIGLDFYRFSLSWTRILPDGFSNKINQAGVDYYNRLLDELKAAGIEPMVTIYHFDTPLALEHLGHSWTNRKMVDYFVDYADVVFGLFGDRVKLWSTINEPNTICEGIPSVLVGIFPEMPLGTYEYLCGHNIILAHSRAYRLYETKYEKSQKGRVSLNLNLNYNIPLTNSSEDLEAAERRNQFEFGWFAQPLVFGDYPQVMRRVIAENSAKQKFSHSRLPTFTNMEKQIITGAYDLIMLNTYTIYQVTMAPYNNTPSLKNDEQTKTSQPRAWPKSAIPKFVYHPTGMRGVLRYIRETYKNPEIIITENGYSDLGGLNDTTRLNYIRDILQQVHLAMCEDHVNITAYTVWSLVDNLEWSQGYRPKFGIVQVDFDSPNLTRTLKQSAYYYKRVIQSHSINSPVYNNE